MLADKISKTVFCCFFLLFSKSYAQEEIISFQKLINDTLPFPGHVRNVNASNYLLSAKGVNFDSAALKKVEIIDNGADSIPFLVGTRNGREMVVFDTNSNGKFDDETAALFDENGQWIKLSNLRLSTGGKSHIQSMYLRTYLSKLEIEVNGTPKKITNKGIVLSPVYYYSKAKLKNGLSYKMALYNGLQDSYTAKNAKLLIVPADKLLPSPRMHPVTYKVGDTIYLDKSIYRFDSVFATGNRIVLRRIGQNNKNLGISVGKYAFNLSLTNLLNGQVYRLGNTGKMTLLEFWGTWCQPCLKLTDELKELHKRFKEDGHEMFGVAYDQSVDKVAKYLREKNIEWVNTFDNNANSLISSKFKVLDFPTFILLDREGKIIFRDAGTDGFSRLKEYLSKQQKND